MRVLLFGGTLFVGRHIVDALLARGHEPVLFHRGLTGSDLFPNVERILGDRETDLARLDGLHFDAVVDPSGYVPHVVRASAERLRERAERYLFISSISAYDSAVDRFTESGPLAELPPEACAELPNDRYYGALKALCEGAASAAFGPERTILVRPGLVVGPYDPTDRYSYWPARMARGGEVLAPNAPHDPVQYIDGRDLANWIVVLLENGAYGAFNAISPRDAFTLGDVLEAARVAAESDAHLTWVDNAFLEAQNVGQWVELPLWIAPSAGIPAFFNVDSARAVESGLTVRSPLRTARETLAWLRSRPTDRNWAAGMTAERESALLALWHNRPIPT
jgi:2'-hydroxyisoflavone reductase